MRLDAALAQHKIHIITLPSGYTSSYDREKGSRIISSRAAAAARRTSARHCSPCIIRAINNRLINGLVTRVSITNTIIMT